MTNSFASALGRYLEEELPAAVELRHVLHADPEPSGAEWATAARVTAAIGSDDDLTVAETGRLVRIGGPGPCVALRAELDALPVNESGAEDVGTHQGLVASTNGYMHACGHDVHLAALVALLRAASRIDLPLPMLGILQPREEKAPSGARDLVGHHLLHRQEVAAVVGAHVQPLLRAGVVAATPGTVNAATDQFEIVVTGRGGHGGYPHLTRDPVAALAQVVVALQQLVSRRLDPLHPAALTIGSIKAGDAANVVPDEARAWGTLRLLEPSDCAFARGELVSIVEHVSAAFGCRGEVRIKEGEPALMNHPDLAAFGQRRLADLGFEIATLRSCGADDFSWYGDVAPILMMFVGLDRSTNGPGSEPAEPWMLHQPTFRPPDATIGDVARTLLAGYLAAVDLVSGDVA